MFVVIVSFERALDVGTGLQDMEAVVWLETYLANFKKILLIVSHSQVCVTLLSSEHTCSRARAHGSACLP